MGSGGPAAHTYAMTTKHRTARVVHTLDTSALAALSGVEHLPLTDRGAAAVEKLEAAVQEQPLPTTLETHGRLDFVTRAWLVETPFELLVIGGRRFERASDDSPQWRKVADDGGDVPTLGQPLWLLESLLGIARSDSSGAGRLRGSAVAKYDCVVDLIEADGRTRAGLSIPAGEAIRRLRAANMQLWLDDHGRATRVALTVAGVRASMDLCDFDSSAPIAIPRAA